MLTVLALLFGCSAVGALVAAEPCEQCGTDPSAGEAEGDVLTGFQHLHPTLASDGTWTAEVDLAEPGAWRVVADARPASPPPR